MNDTIPIVVFTVAVVGILFLVGRAGGLRRLRTTELAAILILAALIPALGVEFLPESIFGGSSIERAWPASALAVAFGLVWIRLRKGFFDLVRKRCARPAHYPFSPTGLLTRSGNFPVVSARGDQRRHRPDLSPAWCSTSAQPASSRMSTRSRWASIFVSTLQSRSRSVDCWSRSSGGSGWTSGDQQGQGEQSSGLRQG